MKRRPVPKSNKIRSKFNDSVQRTKAANVAAPPMRGGIRF